MSSKVVEVYFASEVIRNPGPGGWGVLLRCEDYEKELSGSVLHVCQNRLDTMALVAAFAAIKTSRAIKVFSDSEYVKKCVVGLLPLWRLRHWKEPNAKTKNLDLWMKLDPFLRGSNVEWAWTKSGIEWPCDQKLKAAVQREVERVKTKTEQPRLF